jgi:Mn-containing catalase
VIEPFFSFLLVLGAVVEKINRDIKVIRIKDPEIKDLFLDIAAEELGHMEMVAQTIHLLNGHDVDAVTVQAGEVQTHVQLGLNPGLINASGYSWTADYR